MKPYLSSLLLSAGDLPAACLMRQRSARKISSFDELPDPTADTLSDWSGVPRGLHASFVSTDAAFQTFGRPGRNTLDIRPVGGMARRTDIRPAATLDRLRCGRRGGRGGTVQVGHIYASRRCRPGPIRPLCPERRVRQQMRLSRSGDLPAASGPGHARRHRCFRPEGPERPSGVDNGSPSRPTPPPVSMFRQSNCMQKAGSSERSASGSRSSAGNSAPSRVELLPRPLAASCGRRPRRGPRHVERRPFRGPCPVYAAAGRCGTKGRHDDTEQGPVEQPVFRLLRRL